jgi:hypothetical protein
LLPADFKSAASADFAIRACSYFMLSRINTPHAACRLNRRFL